MTTFLPFLFILFHVNPSQADLCNFHGTLFEAETFYLTRPYSHTISLDLENYQAAFHTFPKKLETFSNLFRLYEREADLNSHEPLPLIPLDSNTNVFKTSSKVIGTRSFSECARNNGSLLAISHSNRNKVIEIMKTLDLQKIPFLSYNVHKIFSNPGMEVLDDQVNYKTLEAIHYKTPVYLKADNSFEYPTDLTAADLSTSTTTTSTTVNPTTTSATTTTTTIAPLEHQYYYSLCTKPNNPWDRESSRKTWLRLVPQIRNAIKFLQELGHTYTQTANTLSKLPKSSVSDISRSLKLILPEPLKAILNFLDRFSSKRQWESTNPNALDLFSAFVKDTFKAIKLFNLDSSITNIKAKPKKRFRLLNFNDLHWKDFFDLDEELYGISGPISVTPFDQLPLDTRNTIFIANVRFRIFHRHDDKCTIYQFRPNIFQHQIVDIKNILHTKKFSLASKEDFVPHECHTQSTELHRICHKIPPNAFEPKDYTQMSECGSAMFSPTYNEKHTFCPLSSPPSDPLIYRADCQNDDHSSLIVSSTHPIRLAFVCDGKFDSAVNFTTFPSKVHTGCEARLLDSSTPGLIVPQSNPDFLQDPVLGPIFPYLQPASLPQFNYLLYVVVPSAIGIFLLLLALIAFCIYRKFFKTPAQDLGPPVRSGTFRVISTNPSLIELRAIENRRTPSIRNNYPILD